MLTLSRTERQRRKRLAQKLTNLAEANRVSAIMHLAINTGIFELKPGSYTFKILIPPPDQDVPISLSATFSPSPVQGATGSQAQVYTCVRTQGRYAGTYQATSLRQLVFQITDFKVRKSVNAREWLIRNAFQGQVFCNAIEMELSN